MNAHGHGSVTAAGRHTRPLAWALAFTVAFLLVEMGVGLWSRSLALLADAGHMVTDAASLALALVAIWFAAKPATPAKSYGYYRVEILAALVNAVVLLGISAAILVEAYRRWIEPPDVMAGPMIVVAVLGLAVNLVSARLLRSGSQESLNVHGAYLEVLSDALGSIGVLVAGLVVATTGWRLADPLVAAAIGLFIVPRTWKLLRQAVNVLLEATPPHVDVAEVTAAMQAVPGVRGVHDLHIWTLTSGKHAMSAHVLVDDAARSTQLLDRLHAVLHEKFRIDHTTIQLEPPPILRIRERS